MWLDKLYFETPWSWSCFEARPGLKQDQDQDLLVHQDQDQDQGLAHAYYRRHFKVDKGTQPNINARRNADMIKLVEFGLSSGEVVSFFKALICGQCYQQILKSQNHSSLSKQNVKSS